MKTSETLLVLAIMTMALGCGKSDREVRLYREVSYMADDAKRPELPSVAGAMPPGGTMPDLPPELQAPALPLEWATPAGWELQPASGMRIATFRVSGQECTILSFPGNVGGDEANIRRWLGQIGASVTDEALKAFVDNPSSLTTAGGHEGRVYDFARLLPSGSSVSVLAAVIPVGDQSVFVKFTGDRDILASQSEAFMVLCRSIRLKTEAPPYE